jgi:hypothetical protein
MIPASYLFKQTYMQAWEDPEPEPVEPQPHYPKGTRLLSSLLEAVANLSTPRRSAQSAKHTTYWRA